MSHPVLQGPQRRTRCRHACPEGVAQLVKRDVVDVGSHDRLLEATDELGAVKRIAGVRMAEHEVAVARVQRVLAQFAERDRRALPADGPGARSTSRRSASSD